MGNEMSSLHKASADNNVGLIRRLLQQERLDPNLQDKVGRRAIPADAPGITQR